MSGKKHKGVSHFEPSSQTQKNTDRSSLRTAINKTGAGDLATPGNGSRLPLHETAVALSTHPARITVRRRRMSDIAVMIFAAGAMATAFPSHCVAASADGGGAGATSAAGDGGAGGGGNEGGGGVGGNAGTSAGTAGTAGDGGDGAGANHNTGGPGTGGTTGGTSLQGAGVDGSNAGQFGGGGGGGAAGLVVSSSGTRVINASYSGGSGGVGGSGSLGQAGGGGGGAGIIFTGGGTLTISGSNTIDGGSGGSSAVHNGGGGGGGVGIFVDGGTLNVESGADLRGGAGGLRGGGGGAGAAITSNVVVNNDGGLGGGQGEPGTTTTGIAAGVPGSGLLVLGSDNTINNSANGVIAAGGVSPGVALGTALYVAGNNNSIFDAGSILGSTGSGGFFGDAVELAGNNNRFELQDGAGFHGNVVSTGQNNIFALGGAANGTFDLSSIVSSINATSNATQFAGFSQYQKTGTSTWTATGAVGDSTPWAIEQGTLALSGTGDLSAASSVTVGTGATTGTLDISGVTASTSTLQSLAGNASGQVVLGSKTLNISNGQNQNFQGVISGTGGVTMSGGEQTLSGANTYSGGTLLNGGILSIASDSNLGASTGALAFNGGTLENTASTQSSRAVTLDAGGGTFQTDADLTLTGPITGTGALTKTGAGVLITTADNTYTGDATIASGTLAVGDASHPGAALSGGGATQVDAGATLGGYGSVTGTVTNNGTVAVANAVPGFAGNANGNFTINGTLTSNGLVSVGGTGVGNALVVTNYVGGAGSTINLNTYLGGDGSPSDLVKINGGTATGSSRLTFHNVGGAGAVTTGNGILVVDAINGGTTAAGAFTGGVAVGPYQYSLYRGAADGSDSNDYYLRSTIDCTAAPAVCGSPTPTPTPSTTIPDYRSGISLYMAVPSMALNYGESLMDSLQQRMGEDEQFESRGSKNDGTWGRVIAQHGWRNGGALGIYGTRGPSFNYDTYAAQGGIDVYRNQRKDGSRDFAGVYGAVGQISGDVTNFDGAPAGRDQLTGYTLGGYWTHFGASGWYLDAQAQGTRYDVNASSPSDMTLKTSGYGLGSSLQGGYPIPLPNNWSIVPQAQLVYQNLSLNDSGDTASSVYFHNANSLAGRIGAEVKKSWLFDSSSTHAEILNTWFRTDLRQEFVANPRVSFSSATGPVAFESDSRGSQVELSAGVTAQFRSVAFYASAGYDFGVGVENHSNGYGGKVGLRYNW
ncbi:autotransporter outer membrane beta-barrel domain-containing protein [Paraburkholderia sediminicola]|uniref:autotransporter family protein n=1 Tax=Paraburkholderia sediminicola TaxID=458836 RepID=UPI0038BA8325